MKNTYFLKMTTIWVISLLGIITANAQTSLPPLDHYFPLNNGSSFDNILQENGIKHGELAGHLDRFGNQSGATTFLSNGASITSQYPEVEGTPPDKTVSFWTYIDNPSSIPSGIPPLNNPREIYNYVADQVSSLGMARNNGTLGVNRYIKKVAGAAKVPWYLWAYKPISFDQQGWYQIFHISAQNYSKIYMFKPDGSMACSFNYMGHQSWNGNVHSLVLGGYNGELSPVKVLDDFKVYGGVLDEEQILEQYDQEKVPEGGYYQIVNRLSGKALDNWRYYNNDAEIHQFTPDVNKSWQQWLIIPNGNYVNIINKSSTKALDNWNSLNNDTKIHQFTSDINKGQQDWEMRFVGNDGENYYNIVNRNSGKALDNWGYHNNDALIYQYTVDSSKLQQQWYIRRISVDQVVTSGKYRIVANDNITTLTFENNPTVVSGEKWSFLSDERQNWYINRHNGGTYSISLEDKTGKEPIAKGTKWYIVSSGTGDGKFTLQNKSVKSYQVASGPALTNDQNDCTVELINIESPPTAMPKEGNSYNLVNHSSQKVLDNWGSYNNDTKIYQFQLGSTKIQQKWKFQKVGEDNSGIFYNIVNAQSQKALDNWGYHNNDAFIYQFTVDPSKIQQQWYLNWTGRYDTGGFPLYFLVNRSSGKVLDNWHSYSNDTAIHQYEKHGGDWQYWSLKNTPSSTALKVSLTEIPVDNSKYIAKIYPIPSKGTLHVPLDLEQAGTVSFSFYDLQGRKIYSEDQRVTQDDQIVTLENLKGHGFIEGQFYILKTTSSTGKNLLTSRVIFDW